MSIYNFNHLQQPPNHDSSQNNPNFHVNNHSNHLLNGAQPNGTTSQGRYQIDNDYLSRGFVSTTNHSDMSVQLTRPTSKTALLVRQRRAMLEQLSCYICQGYLIDATTIDECMDSFCKSCIVVHLRNHNNCPKCGTLIQKTNPFTAIHSDKVLQDIVYKLVPGLYDNEMKRRREFYRNICGGNNTPTSSSDDDGSCGSLTIERSSSLTSEQYGIVSHPKSFYKPTDSIDLSIEPHTRGDSSAIYFDNKRQSIVTCFTGSLQQRPSNGSMFSSVDSQEFKTYLRCPASLTTLQLKKFIAAKFNICKDDTIHLLYLNESLKDEYSLIDVAYIYDWRGIEHMRLFYIIERDLTKAENMKDFQAECQTPRKSKLRHSVGTSTQTPKRVCIDPHPKFYDEQNNNDGNSNVFTHPCGRTMRPRIDTSSATKVSKQSNQLATPILRSSSTARSDSALQSDRALNRELLSLGNRVDTSPFVNDVSTAIGELSYLKGDNSKETRSTRKQITATKSIPRINIQLPSVSQATDSIDRAFSSQGKVSYEDNNSRMESLSSQKHTNNRQIIPFVRGGYSSVVTSTLTNPPQSSVVTLASFAQAHNNNLVTMSSSAATTISNSYKNIQSTGSSTRPEARTDQTSKGNQQPPQLAFKFITERGVTIVRQMVNRGESEVASTSSSSMASIKPSTSLPALPGPTTTSSQVTTNSSNINSGARSAGNPNAYQTSAPYASSSSGTGTNTGINHDGISGRHHLKVKPVYKTFVDPTKLKSPNFKKLGYTARH